MTPPRAISFDLDDTLWSCDDVIGRAERAVYDWLERHYPRITGDFDLEAMRRIRIETAAERPELQADLTRLRHETLRWHAREAGYDPSLAETAVEVFLEERHRVALYEDVLPVLERLAGRVRLVALTNGNADVRRTEIGEWFDVAVSAADVGAPKPDPAMFERACRELSIRRATCCTWATIRCATSTRPVASVRARSGSIAMHASGRATCAGPTTRT